MRPALFTPVRRLARTLVVGAGLLFFAQIALIPLILQESEWHLPECITVQELANDLPAPFGFLYLRTHDMFGTPLSPEAALFWEASLWAGVILVPLLITGSLRLCGKIRPRA